MFATTATHHTTTLAMFVIGKDAIQNTSQR
jgi:hypothetical protein